MDHWCRCASSLFMICCISRKLPSPNLAGPQQPSPPLPRFRQALLKMAQENVRRWLRQAGGALQSTGVIQIKMSTLRNGLGWGSVSCHLGPEMASLRILCMPTHSLSGSVNKTQLTPPFIPSPEFRVVFQFQSCNVPHALSGNQTFHAGL